MNIDHAGMGFAGIVLLATALGAACLRWVAAGDGLRWIYFNTTSFISAGPTAKRYASSSTRLESTFSDTY